MPYSYAEFRPKIFTDEGQREFLLMRDAAAKLLRSAGAFRLDCLLHESGICGDSWMQLAYVDRLEELGEIRKVYSADATQYRIYIGGKARMLP